MIDLLLFQFIVLFKTIFDGGAKPGDSERAALEGARREVTRIDATVRALLERARPRALNTARTSLVEVVRRAVLLARDHAASVAARGRKVSIEFEPARGPIIIPIDAAQIEDAVLNLLLNPIEAIEKEGRVIIHVSCQSGESEVMPDGEAIIEVTDTGRGIAADNLEHIFNPSLPKQATASPQLVFGGFMFTKIDLEWVWYIDA